MTKSKTNVLSPNTEHWLKTRKENEQKLEKAGIWSPAQEHDPVGLGL